MATYTSLLSTEESTFFNIINKIGSLSVWQAQKILEKYMFCSNAQAKRIIQNLCNHQYITMSTNSKFLTAGVRTVKFQPKVDTKVIRAMHVCIDFVDSLEEMKFTHIPTDNTNLVFLASGNLYKVMEIHASEQFKIIATQQNYTDALIAQKKNNPSAKNAFTYTTIFSIPASEDKEEIFDMFENTDISFPTAIAYFNSDELNDTPNYELYKLNLE